jgi:GTP pyrophosphokinase
MVRRIEDILERVQQYNPDADLDLLRKAYIFSAREHRDQVRSSGEPYLVHPLEVAYLLADLRLDTASIVAGLLHDVVEDTLTTVESVAEYFGEDVAHIVEGVTKISKLKFASDQEAQAQNLRKMILAMVDDIRVILVKLADRLHNMRTLGFLEPDRRERIARETREIYSPIANRLGIGRMKAELEDLAFRHLEPEAYAAVTKGLESRRKVSDRFIHEIQDKLHAALDGQRIDAEITGRIKTVYSIYKKMQVQKISVDQVYDYIAFRIITATVKDYQSLHTSVMTDKGHPFEIQLRTREMHSVAEEGIAAHWQYKEGGQTADQDQDQVSWLRQILEWQQDLKDPRDFVQLVKVDLFPEEVYTFTPKGKVVSFQRGATPIDFAYAIHTEVGHRCMGAKVNGKIVPLKYVLQNGDIVEILTQPGRHPSRDWLGLAHTSRARSKIRAWLNANERERSLALGKELTEKEFRKYKISIKKAEDGGQIEAALTKLGYAALDDFFSAVGYGKVTPHALLVGLVPETELKVKPEGVVSRAVKRALGRREAGIKVSGMDDMMISLARCCNPVRGEDIVGYISRGKGVSIHSVQCPNVAQLMYDSERRIDVEWTAGHDGRSEFAVKLLLDVEDQQGLLAKVVSAVSEEKTNIKNVEAKTFETSDAQITMTIVVSDRKHMDRILNRIRRINGVRAVERALS